MTSRQTFIFKWTDAIFPFISSLETEMDLSKRMTECDHCSFRPPLIARKKKEYNIYALFTYREEWCTRGLPGWLIMVDRHGFLTNDLGVPAYRLVGHSGRTSLADAARAQLLDMVVATLAVTTHGIVKERNQPGGGNPL
jgi:hypothetical protein